jgi:hypothetical protein
MLTKVLAHHEALDGNIKEDDITLMAFAYLSAKGHIEDSNSSSAPIGKGKLCKGQTFANKNSNRSSDHFERANGAFEDMVMG